MTEAVVESGAAEKALRELENAVLRVAPSSCFDSLFSFHAKTAASRARQVETLLARLERSRSRLRDTEVVEPTPGKAWWDLPPIEETRREQDEAKTDLQLDFEALYMFGNLLLEHWSQAACCALGLEPPDGSSFGSLVRHLEQREEVAARPPWSACVRDLIWLDAQIRYYRNRLVVHQEIPRGWGIFWNVFTHEFGLSRTTLPAWLDHAARENEMAALKPIAEKWLPDAARGASAQALSLEFLFHNLDAIGSAADRRAVLQVVSRYGCSTPPFRVVGRRLLRFIVEASRAVSEAAVAAPGNISLKRPPAGVA